MNRFQRWWQGMERKAVTDYTDLVAALFQTYAGVPVDESNALRYSTVWACVRVISEDCSTLPLILYERLARGKRRAIDHPLYRVLHDQPNPQMSAQRFREALTAHVLTWGNGYAHIVRDGTGQARELWLLLPSETRPRRNERTRELFYETRHPQSGQMVLLEPSEVFHVAGLGYDGVCGYSPVAMHRQAIGLGLATQEFGARFFGQGTNLGGFIEVPNNLGEQQWQKMKKELTEARAGLRESHKWTILDNGAKATRVTIPPDEAQFIETMKHIRTEFASIYRIPPHKIGDFERATFSNVEHMDMDYYKSTLRPWLVRWEQEIWMKLLSPKEQTTFFAEHLSDAILRGDTFSRYQAYQLGRQGGWLSANDIREKENMDPVDGGDVYLEPLNMKPLGEPAPAASPSPNGDMKTPLKEPVNV